MKPLLDSSHSIWRNIFKKIIELEFSNLFHYWFICLDDDNRKKYDCSVCHEGINVSAKFTNLIQIIEGSFYIICYINFIVVRIIFFLSSKNAQCIEILIR